MNFLHMTYFIAVVEHESISGAAQSLFITQQTLSSHVAAMEKELGTSLFDRRPKFRLTQAGEIFYRYCIRFRNLNDAMVSEFRDLSGEVSDILHVGISQTRSRILMPSILLRMHREFPRVQVRLTEQTNEVLIKKLLYDPIIQKPCSSLRQGNQIILSRKSQFSYTPYERSIKRQAVLLT